MSEQIIATTFTDPAINAIRAQVAANDDRIPYLLLPVKIETRFMRVDRPVKKPNRFGEVLSDLSNLETYSLFDPTKLPIHEVSGRYKKIAGMAASVSAKLSEMETLDGPSKEALTKKISALLKQNKLLGTSAGKLKNLDNSEIIQLRTFRNSAESSLNTALSIVQTLQPELPAGDTFLHPLQAIVDALTILASAKTAATSRLDKRQVVGLIEANQSLIAARIRDMQKIISSNYAATAEEIKQLTVLSRQLQPLGKNSVANIKKLHSTYQSVTYTAKQELIAQKLTLLQQEIDKRFKPKLQIMQEIHSVNIGTLLTTVTNLLSDVQAFNKGIIKHFGEIIRMKKLVFQQLERLITDSGKVIVGTEDELIILKNRWDATDKALANFCQKLSTITFATDGQKTEIDKSIETINTVFRHQLSNLKSGKTPAITRLNNRNLDKAITAFNKSLEAISELNEKMKAAKTPTSSLTKRVSQLQNDIEESLSFLRFLPRQAHAILNKATKEFTENIDRLEKSASSKNTGSKKTDITAASHKINALLERSKSTGITAVKKGKLTETVPPLILATPTVTRDELWARIYPDDIAVHTHEEALTQAEVDSGKAYWTEIWAAGEDADLKLAAWRSIVASFGTQRAAWIIKSLEPKSEINKARDTLFENSKVLMKVNTSLEELYKILNKPMDPATLFSTLGAAFPLLQNILALINKIRQDNIILLQKTQQKLLKIKSLLLQFITIADRIKQEPTGIGEQIIHILQAFLKTFNALTQKFQTIDKLSSRDIISNTDTKDTFPEVEIKDSSWTQVPHSRVMPDKFVVITMRDGICRHLQVTETIPANIPVGIHPSMMDNGAFVYDEDNNLVVDDSIKWLTDFKDAEAKGMALHITLEQEDVTNGFDKVFVLGVKSTTSAETKKLIEDLIDNHHYIPEGASFLPVGTATNNTESGSSGYRKIEEDEALSFSVERNSELPYTHTPDPDFPTDSERLAELLGINSLVLRNLDYSNRTEISEALTLNKALFPGTIANYMEEGLDALFTRDNIQRTKLFFNNYVSARGFLPALRTGTQPYGILATTAFSRFSVTANDAALPVLTKEDFEHPSTIQADLQTRYDIRLKQLLALIDALWTDIRNSRVAYAGNTNPDDPQAHFMTMLGLDAISEEHFYRYGVNVAARQGNEELNINFDSNDPWSPAQVADNFGNQVFSGYYFQSDNFNDEQFPNPDPSLQAMNMWNRINKQFSEARVFAMRHLQDQSQVLGEKIDNTALSDTVAVATDPNAGTPEEQLEARKQLPYFIDWLLDQNPWDVHAENKFSVVGDSGLTEGMPSKSLLFMLLRHSVLSAYADTILKILELEGLTDQVTIKKMGSTGYYYQRFAANFSYVTKWTYLFSKINRLNGVLGFNMEETNSFYVYMNGLANTPNGYLNRYLSPESTSVFNNYVNHAQHQPFVDELNETKNAVRKLKDIPTARLEVLLREHIDLCTYRLDAWKLGMVNKRLKENRATAPTGIFLGAYGWIENLRKGGERTPAKNIPPELWQTGDEPVFTDADNLGFIHTPSLNHAVTAAILRAGFHANKATDEVDNLLAVNLSSERIRMALNLLNGIRSGQETGALLGYQFERGLHERYLHIPLELDQYIYDFRDEFPLSLPVDATVDSGEVNMTQVVNGLELLEAAQEFIETKGGPPNAGDSLYQSLKQFETAWWNSLGNTNLNNANAAKKDAMLKEIDRMADAFDALGDLCVSESIYQVSKGNYIRSASIMDKLAKGDVPFDIEFADTPRTGTIVTHKVGLFLENIEGIDQPLAEGEVPLAGAALTAAITASGARPAGWNIGFTAAALAEPVLNKWAGGLIGDPSKIKCLVSYTIEDTVSLTVTLADLEVHPLDVLRLFGTGPLDGGAELNARVAAQARKSIVLPADFVGTADDIIISIQYTLRDSGWAESDYSFYEKAGYIQSIREIITNSAPLAADDLLIPGAEEVPEAEVRNLQPDELHTRISNLFARLQLVSDAFTEFFETDIAPEDGPTHSFTNTEIDELRLLLNTASGFAIPGAVPDTVVSYSDAIGLALLNAAGGAAKSISARLQQSAKDLETGANTTLSPEARVNALKEAAKKLLGKVFIVLPHFKIRNIAELQTQNNLPANKGLLRAAPIFAMEEWSQSTGRVRQRLSVLETIEMWAENFATEFPAKKPFQFPFTTTTDGTASDHWLGIEFPEGYQPVEDKLSLVLMNAETALDAAEGSNTCGLLIDEWVEIIPNNAEKTGITFNYDQPDAKAPNSLLLAVTPKQTGKWSWDDLAETLHDTLELAKNRAVEPEHLEDSVFGQILPALLTEVVPPQLLPGDADNSGDAQNNPLGLQVVTDIGVVNDTFVPEEP